MAIREHCIVRLRFVASGRRVVLVTEAIVKVLCGDLQAPLNEAPFCSPRMWWPVRRQWNIQQGKM
jgi:hypothetical protein